MLGISWVTAQLAASQEGLSSMSEWVICLMYTQASTPASSIESRLYVVPFEAPEKAVPHHIFYVSAAFKFHHFRNKFLLPLYDKIKLQYSNSLWTHRKLNALGASAAMQEFHCDHKKDNILLQHQWKGLALKLGTMNIPSNLAWKAML
jgi:hypothetical protein